MELSPFRTKALKLPFAAPGKIPPASLGMTVPSFSHKNQQQRFTDNPVNVPGEILCPVLSSSALFTDNPDDSFQLWARNVVTLVSQMFKMRRSICCPLWTRDRPAGPRTKC